MARENIGMSYVAVDATGVEVGTWDRLKDRVHPVRARRQRSSGEPYHSTLQMLRYGVGVSTTFEPG